MATASLPELPEFPELVWERIYIVDRTKPFQPHLLVEATRSGDTWSFPEIPDAPTFTNHQDVVKWMRERWPNQEITAMAPM